MSAVLSATTFCTSVREFSPLDVCAGETKMAPLGRSRKPGDWVRSRGSNPATEPIWASPSLPLRLLPTCLVQLAIDTSNSQVGHDVARFTSIRDSWAAFLLALSSSGMDSPVPKYISSGV